MDYKVINPAPIASSRKIGRWANPLKRKDEDNMPKDPTLAVDTVFSGSPEKLGDHVFVRNPRINGRSDPYAIVTISRGGEVYCVPVTAAGGKTLEERVAELELQVAELLAR